MNLELGGGRGKEVSYAVLVLYSTQAILASG